jgi:two-component system, NtrC family, response regulator HydG
MVRSMRILVVDDDIDNAQSLAELFELEGHDAMVVHSGEAAIAAHMTLHFDLAFMDVMMPGLNGVESFLRIRKMRPQAKIFMMTGYSVEELLRQAVEQGAMGVLSKPMDVDAILKMVDEVGRDGLMVAPAACANYSQTLQDAISSGGRRSFILHGQASVPPNSTADDILILDLKAPLIDSVGYCNNLRSEGRHQPAIIVTPQSARAEVGHEALRDMMVTGILNKPFDPMELLDRLDILAA